MRKKLLLGPGPTEVPPSVLEAMARPTLSHLDPEFLDLLDALNGELRALFQTKNQLTFPISGTGSAGMEAAFANLVEGGDRVAVLANGVFGERMAEVAKRLGGEVAVLRKDWGLPFEREEVEAFLAEQGRVAVGAFVLAETSTGVWQVNAKELCESFQRRGALVVLDAVTALGGLPVEVDAWKVDCCYAGSQKAISAPPGLAPITFSKAALEKALSRKEAVRSWYFDITLIRRYLGSERVYHHTAPVNAIYGLKRACELIFEEGLEARFKRHLHVHSLLKRGLEQLGLSLLPPSDYQLPTLNTILFPEGLDVQRIQQELLSEFAIEVGGGLGRLQGKILRVGTMGHSAQIAHVLYFLFALRTLLKREGWTPAVLDLEGL